MRYRRLSGGFILPTVVITSVVLFAVLAAVVSIVASTETSLDAQFYENLAADAAESGTTHADSCLQDNNFVSTWGASALHPNTSCTGGVACTNIVSCFVVSTPQYRSTYTVNPVQNPGNGVQTVAVTGTVQLLRQNGEIWNTYTKVLNIRVGAQVTFSQIAMGYVGGSGAFFGTVGRDGIMRAVGYNGYGQLGNGTQTSTLIPTKFQVPTTTPIVAAYTNFLSLGYTMFAVDSLGNAYGAGVNDHGQTGTGISVYYKTTPSRVLLPAGVSVRSIAQGTAASYFLGSDNNLYATGSCTDGVLGSSYTIAGCSDQLSPVRVNLPTPNLSDPNTIPSDNIVADADSVYVRMQGGRVYAWGHNDRGQLGNVNIATSLSSPAKVSTYGDPGQPVATQIATDGATLYILDSSGQVNSVGSNKYGSMGNTQSSFLFWGLAGTMCLENTSSDGVNVYVNTCTGAANQQFSLRSDGTIYNAAKNVCLNTTDGTVLKLAACSTATSEKFTWNPAASSLVNRSNSKCIDHNTTLWLYACNGTAAQSIDFFNAIPTPFTVTGTVKKIWTDQRSLSVLTDAGQVWSAGINPSGQFGNGTTGYWNPAPVQFQMAVPAVDIYETNSGDDTSITYQNLYAIGNDGRVYGAGSNAFGQLGNGTTSVTAVSTPVVMGVIDGSVIKARQVQSGYGTTIIISTTGNVYSVGNNGNGQLGDGTTVNRSTPIYSKYINPQNVVAY